MNTQACWHLVVVLFSVLEKDGAVTGERIWKEMYTNIPKAYFCFRRGNGTHSFGCSSDFDSNVGVVMLADKESQLNWIVEKGNAPPYTVLLTPEMFTLSNLKFLEASGKLSGVILLNGKDMNRPSKFSSDSRCPNNPTSLYKNTEAACVNEKGWNSAGSEMMFQRFSFPIVYVKHENATKYLLKDCYEKFNKPLVEGGEPRDWPLCAVELDAFMFQATDSRRCLYRDNTNNNLQLKYTSFCGELADMNIFKLLSPPISQEDSYPDNSVIVVSTKIDTMTLFDKMEISSESPATGMVVLLAAAKLLSNLKELNFKDGVSNILFAFLHGESFDYIGSSRMVYDMEKGRFPCTSYRPYSVRELDNLKDCKTPVQYRQKWPKVGVESIRSYLDLGQLYSDSFDGLVAHVDAKYDATTGLVENLKNSFGSITVSQASNKERGLPASSLQSLLKVRRNAPGALLTNFDQEMRNNYYHSIFDDYVSAGIYNYSLGSGQHIVQRLSRVAEGVASYLFHEATGQGDVPFEMNRDLMNELLNCYVNTKNCELYAKASTPDIPPQRSKEEPEPFPQYVSVLGATTLHSIFLDKVLTYLTGQVVDGNVSEDDCKAPEDQNIYRYYFVRGRAEDPDCEAAANLEGKDWAVGGEKKNTTCGRCVRTTSWFSRAMSPAFDIDGYDFEDGQKYAAWTESVWNSQSARVFLKADPAVERGFLASGAIVLVVSYIFVWWLNKFSEEIFGDPLEASLSDQRPKAEDEADTTTTAQRDPVAPSSSAFTGNSGAI